MTGKEIITTALSLQPTQRLPVILLSGGSWALNSANITLEAALALPPKKRRQHFIMHITNIIVDNLAGFLRA